MVKVHYLGIGDPAAAFEPLKPAHSHVIRLMMKCRPYDADYKALLALAEAMNAAAAHFMPGRFDTFFGAGAPKS